MPLRESRRTRKPTSKASTTAVSNSPTNHETPTAHNSDAITAATSVIPARVDTSAIAAAVAAVEAVPHELAYPPDVEVDLEGDVTASAAAVAAIATGGAGVGMGTALSAAHGQSQPSHVASQQIKNSSGTGTTQSKPKKPGNPLTPETVDYLKAWMMSPEHISHPYPNEEEKAKILADTGINSKQLTTWFSNNRKRFWKPKMDEEGRTYTTLGNTLTPQVVSFLKAWMMHPSHVEHPYPTDDEKSAIMRATGIDKKQLTTWFSNNRKRFWKPTIDTLRKEHGIPDTSPIPSEILSQVTIGGAQHPTPIPVPQNPGGGQPASATGIAGEVAPELNDIEVSEDILEEAVASAAASAAVESIMNMASEGGILPPLEHPELNGEGFGHGVHEGMGDLGNVGHGVLEGLEAAAPVDHGVGNGENLVEEAETGHPDDGSNKRIKIKHIIEL
mmetsp:Transcript_24502/g.50115  ORF Transcript_24502/g.50115 Transcript_24502/m.50115 type:complete len:445 (+) Transcript_24502:249-1583(+)